MKNKGFTLIEVIVTIAILLAVAGISIPSAISLINRNKTKSHNLQIDEFLTASENYVLDNKTKWNVRTLKDTNKDNAYCFSLDDLAKENYIKEVPLDSLTEEKFNGSIKIYVNDNRIKYEYSNEECNKRLVDATIVDDENYDESLDVGDNTSEEEGKCISIDSNKFLKDKILEDNPVNSGKPYFNTIATTDEGIYKDVDADGTTYYFRGNVKDNYVKIGNLKWHNTNYFVYKNIENANSECNDDYSISYGYSNAEECKNAVLERGHAEGEDMLWRIVRVNGDGTIRLISDGALGSVDMIDDVQFNNAGRNNEKYAGYTYDNSALNVQDGTNSTIKTYLENWYEENMGEYDNLVATTRYCNDTSIINAEGTNIHYGAVGRLMTNKTPQFICPNTTKTYGGEYSLKIGLLSADGASFAGVRYRMDNPYIYLYKGDSCWFGTPYDFSNNHNTIFTVDSSSYFMFSTYSIRLSVAPVINLKADVLYCNGTGEKTNPYILYID